MRRSWISVFLVIFTLTGVLPAQAHFQYLLPSRDIVTEQGGRQIALGLIFGHPFRGELMDMNRPEKFGVFVNGEKKSLLSRLKKNVVNGHSTFNTRYRFKRPGDHIFYVQPEAYWEPAEECFIVHYTKVVVNAFGKESGWGKEVGLKTEIVPLTRPYGLWTGNTFRGRVLRYGEPVPGAEIEVEYLNKNKTVEAPLPAYETQVIKADENGVFSYTIPETGWWAFAALGEGRRKMKHNGKKYPVEIGAVYWVRTREMD